MTTTTTSSTHHPKRKETSIMVYKFKISFSEKKHPLIENLRIKSLNCFSHHVNIIFVTLSCGSFLTSNNSYEWMEYWKYCSISLQNLRIWLYILNKTLGIRLWFYTNTWIVLLIKLQAMALVALLTYSNYITKYITSILLLIFWYYFLAPVANFWKQTHLERYVPVPLEQSLLFTNAHPHSWFMHATAQLENVYYYK